jgi:uncharacterized membrane protein (GlpM family)
MSERVSAQFEILCVIPYAIFYGACQYLFEKNQVNVLGEV